MRIRFKKWARPELEASSFYIKEPEKEKGKWKQLFKEPTNPLHLEQVKFRSKLYSDRFSRCNARFSQTKY